MPERQLDTKYLRMLSRALGNALNGFNIVGPDGLIKYVNRAYARMWGYDDAREVIGMSPSAHCADPSTPRMIIDKLRADGAGRFEFVGLRKDGSTFDVVLDAFLWRDADGAEHYAGSSLDVTQERRDARRLHESELLHRALFECFPYAIFLSPPDVLNNPNPKALELFGWSSSEFKPASLGELSPIAQPGGDISSARAQEHVNAAMAGVPQEFEWRFRRRDGSTFDAEVSLARADLEQEPLLLAIIVDISKRKQAEAVRREVEELHQQVSATVQEGIAVLDHQLRYVAWNCFLERTTGLRAPDVLGRSAAELFPRIRELGIEGLLRRALAGETVRSGDLPWPTSDGKQAGWHVATFTPRRSANGKIIGVVVTLYDTTERKAAEDALRESQRELASVISNLPGMVYRCQNDKNWSMMFVSSGCHALTGYASEALLNNAVVSYAELIDEAHRDMVEQRVGSAVARGEPFEITYRIRKASGEIRWVWERGRGIFDDDGELLFLEGFITDVTERHKAAEERDRLEAQLRHAQKLEAVGQLAGGVAHDFNNILTAIFGNVEVAMETVQREFPRARAVLDGIQQIEESAERASSLTRQLLAFSRRQPTRPELIDINDTLRRLEAMLRRLINEDIELQIECARGVRPVRIDSGQLEQVIVNLVVNARDAMPAGGRVTLATRNAADDEAWRAAHPNLEHRPHIALTVRDTGEGIDPETLERIFEPFFTTKPPDVGTGLGLSTAYGIIRQADGDIFVSSRPGEGAVFEICLPSADEQPRVEECPVAPDSAPSGVETILLAEDDAAVRELTAHMLREAGYTVLTASDGAEALRQAAAHETRIDLLVTDVIMPDMNGRKLADTLTATRSGLRVLYVSGYTANIIAHHGVLDKDVEFLEKPYSRRQLLGRVRELLDRARSRLLDS